MSSSPSSLSSSEPVETAVGGLDLEPLSEVVCHVDVLLGTATMSVRETLRLKRNTVIRLNEPAGDDMHVVVNGVELALGEVVIIDDSTAVRVTEIVAPPVNEVAE